MLSCSRTQRLLTEVEISLCSFRKFIQDSDDDDEAGEADRASQLLTKRIKTQEEKVRS